MLEEFSPIFSSSRVITLRPGRRPAHHVRADAAVGVLREHEQHVRVAARGDELLGAGQATVCVGARAQRGRVGAGLRLGQREGSQLVAPAASGGTSRAICSRRAVREQRQRRGRSVNGDGDGDAGVGARQLLEREHVGEEVRAGAPMLDGHARAHQAELAEPREQLVREAVLAVPCGRVRRDPRARRSARERADLALLVGQLAHRPRRCGRGGIRRGGGRACGGRARASRGRRAWPRRPTAPATPQAPAEPLEAQHLPALLARDPRAARVRVDRDRVADGAQHRQVGLGVRVGPRGREVDALALGQLARSPAPCPRGR